MLRLFVPAADHEVVSGDLLEELATTKLAALGDAGARRWYVSQAARSAAPFLLLRLRRGELIAELGVAQLLVLGVLIALDGFWGMVLSQVPLRAAEIGPGWGATSVAGASVLAAAAAYAHGAAARSGEAEGGRWGRRASPIALSGFVVLAVLALDPLLAPRHYVSPAALTAALSMGALVGCCLARTRDSRTAIRRAS